MEDVALNVKIIHLVREPRAVYYYRMLVSDTRPRNVSMSCPRLLRNLKFWLETPEWLRNRYLLVRYEDLAQTPVRIASQIYTFLGISLPRSVRGWLEQNTNHDAGFAFSHTRDSRNTAIKWRRKLTLDQVLYVQSQCRSVMTSLGYRILTTVELLRNLNFPVIEPLSHLN